jgi:hypothetical protein
MKMSSWDTAIVKAILIGYIPVLLLLIAVGSDAFSGIGSALWMVLWLMLSFVIYLIAAAVFWLLVGLPVHRFAARYFNCNWLVYCCAPIVIALISVYLWDIVTGTVVLIFSMLQTSVFRYGLFRDNKP